MVRLKKLMQIIDVKSRSTIYTYIDNGMPVYYVNTGTKRETPYFDVKEVIEWIKSGQKEG